MKADRTVIVFGVFLFLVGLAVAWNGYGYVQVERGWTLVISGTIGFCTGLVLIALGLVLRELEAISSSTAKTALFLAKARSGASVEPAPGASVEPAQTPHWTPLEPRPPFAPESDAVADQAEEIAPSAAEEPPAKPLMKETAPPLPEALAPEAPAAKAPGWMLRAGSYAASFASAKTKNEPPPAAAPESGLGDDWLEQAIAREATAEEPYEPAPDAAAAGHEPEPVEDSAPSDHQPEPVAESEPAVEPAIGPEPVAEPAPELAEGSQPEPAPTQTSAVVGRYEAHGARYTMYADGTIDAETAHGVYRFASMEELKQFIENNA